MNAGRHVVSWMVAAAALLLLALSTSGFGEGGGSHAGDEMLRQKLAAFASPGNVLEEAKRQLVALESSDYEERRRAMAFLLRAGGVHDLLVEALRETSSPEMKTALRIILEGLEESDAEEKLRLLMRRVSMEKVKGLTGELLDAWEGRKVSNSDTRRLSRAAMLATLTEGDLARLRNALASTTPLVRELAVLGIQRLAKGEDLVGLLQPLLDDESESIRLHAAILLASREVRGCLKTLAALLESESFIIRRQSHEVLAAITGQDLGFYSDGVPAERKAAARLWQRWVAKFGRSAPIRWDKAREWLEAGEDVLE